MTSWAKDVVYRAATGFGLSSLRRRRNAAPILCFHNVVPQEMAGNVGDASLHMGIESFRQAVEVVRAHYQVLSIPELLDRIEAGQSLTGCCAVTFDDAYLGTVRWALPVLAALGLPSTLFVVTGAAGSSAPFWWDVLGAQGTLSALRDEALTECEGRTGKVLLGREKVNLSAELLPAAWDLIADAARSGLVCVGSHTRSHPNLTVLSDEDLAEELRGAQDDLLGRSTAAIGVIAYPYGHVDSRVSRVAEACGYRAGLALGRALVSHQSSRFAVPRLNIPSKISPDALECWLAGLG